MAMKTRQKGTKWENSRLNQPILIHLLCFCSNHHQHCQCLLNDEPLLVRAIQLHPQAIHEPIFTKKLNVCQVECSEPQHATEGSKLNLPGFMTAYTQLDISVVCVCVSFLPPGGVIGLTLEVHQEQSIDPWNKKEEVDLGDLGLMMAWVWALRIRESFWTHLTSMGRTKNMTYTPPPRSLKRSLSKNLQLDCASKNDTKNCQSPITISLCRVNQINQILMT